MIAKKQWLKRGDIQPEQTSWKVGDWVKIKKLSEHPEGKVSACPKEDFIPGQPHFLSLPIDYCVEGYLLVAPEVGGQLFLDRRIRNGVSIPGIFLSSEIQEISGNQIATQNSIYLIEIVNRKDQK